MKSLKINLIGRYNGVDLKLTPYAIKIFEIKQKICFASLINIPAQLRRQVIPHQNTFLEQNLKGVSTYLKKRNVIPLIITLICSLGH